MMGEIQKYAKNTQWQTNMQGMILENIRIISEIPNVGKIFLNVRISTVSELMSWYGKIKEKIVER